MPPPPNQDANRVKGGTDVVMGVVIETVPALLKKSKPWEDYCDGERSLAAAIRKLVGIK